MSHLDTFDPKPKKKDVMEDRHHRHQRGRRDDRELSKKTAGVMDKICVINSMNSTRARMSRVPISCTHELSDARGRSSIPRSDRGACA